MMMVSSNFKRSEFACFCGCGLDAVDVELLFVLEKTRAYFSKPIAINSGCRCASRNLLIGGAKKSQHVFCKAADIVVKNISAPIVATWLHKEFHDKYGIGCYPKFTHIDVRPEKARWGNAW